ncbi:hypothetical protein WJX84_012335 [Apatococcus fuscideae]|uniref:Uncharacterized protein n=1 Tax=Apatococcus fuscideae TaxID=2026836 RepID=A0AAW1T6C3_9CHLO
MAISHVAVKRLVEEPAFCEDLENRWHTTAQQQPLDLLNRCKALNSYLRKEFLSDNPEAALSAHRDEDSASEYTDSDLSCAEQLNCDRQPALDECVVAPSTPPLSEPSQNQHAKQLAEQQRSLCLPATEPLSTRGAIRRQAAICLQSSVDCLDHSAVQTSSDVAGARSLRSLSKPAHKQRIMPGEEMFLESVKEVLPGSAFLALQRAQQRAKDIQAREASLQRRTSDRVADLLPKLAVLMENAEARINS